MTELENIEFGKSCVPALIITVVLMIAIPVVFVLFWRGRHKDRTRIGYLIAGAAGFMVSARMLELALHYFCVIADNPVSRFINGNTAAFVIYGTAAAGVFEECGRHIVMKYIMKKDRTRENAVYYGIGHGGIEILGVLLPSMISLLAIAVLFTSGSAENAMNALNITPETVSAALPSVRAAAEFGYAAAAMNVAERLFAMLVHIGLSVVVFYGVVNAKKVFLPLAVILHMTVDAFPALYQRGALPLWSVEVWAAVWAAAITLIAAKLYRKMREPADS
ncbi:MAG: YhfC family intramembrane metalloprotease [Clostridia bacterium]|nr:YhfC family intramembrane metalloprotease [Clostridia bacterium]